MMAALFAQAAVQDTHAEVLRNIVSLRRSEDLFDDLSDSSDDWQAAIALEQATKSPYFQGAPILHRPFEEAQWNAAIGYPFTHWMHSRYTDGSFGVWYGAEDIETTVHETAYHWQKHLLADAGFDAPGIQIERKLYTVHCDAALLDLRPAVPHFPALIHPQDYHFTQQIGHKLHHEGHPGLISQSARCPGTVYAIFKDKVLSQPKEHCLLTYTTTATGIDIAREPGHTWFSLPRSAGH